MLLTRIARRSRRQVLAGLLAYAVTRGHVSNATTRIDKYQRGARIRRRSIPFVMPLSSREESPWSRPAVGTFLGGQRYRDRGVRTSQPTPWKHIQWQKVNMTPGWQPVGS
jgi:hypothetical protein